MFALAFFRRVRPSIIAVAFFYVMPVILFLRFLIGTIWGVFFLSVFSYWLAWLTSDSKPFNFQDLMMWLDELPVASKTSVVTAIITVVGFLIAFHTATLNWKAKALAEIKQHVANEIESFYTEALNLTNNAEIYVSSLVKAVNNLQSNGASHDAVFDVRRLLEKADDFRAIRDRLSAMSVEVHRITGRHDSVLSTLWGAVDTLEKCASAFEEINKGMWVRVPIVPDGHPDALVTFLAQVNVAECIAFSECCDRNTGFISANSGAIRGLLLAPVVGFNLASRMSLSGKRAVFIEAMQKAQRDS